MADVLSRIHSAVVLADGDAPDFPEAALGIAAFFRERGIPMTLKAVHRKGWILTGSDEELFISLLPWEGWHLSYRVRKSRAVLKAGRSQLKGNLFDLVVSAPDGASPSQMEIFSRMVQIMQQIV